MPIVKRGKGKTSYGPGVDIILDFDELARAIDLYLYSKEIYIDGPRTIWINGKLIREKVCRVSVDPSGSVLEGGKKISGSG